MSRPDPSHSPRALSQQAHRRLIGCLGLCLPVLLYVLAGIRPVAGLAPWAFLPSVSAYYYTSGIGVFVGVLFALALFLLTYPGYEGVVWDRLIGRIGGTAALGVALFPTEAPPRLAEPGWWSAWMKDAHHASAVVLFACFILFSVWLFRKSSIPDKEDRPPDKRRRDNACLACGIVMSGSVLWAASSLVTKAPIFAPEAIAIVAFAVSWLVKGEAYLPFLAAVRRQRAAR